MQKIIGTLNFYGWFHPWKVFTEDEKEINIHPILASFFEKLANQPVVFEDELEGFRLVRDENSPKKLEYKVEGDGVTLALVNKDGSFGVSNLTVSIPDTLQRINGRNVIITLTETEMLVQADSSQEIYKLPYTHGSMASIPKGIEQSQCQIGTTYACAFCVGTEDGFECAKGNSSLATTILDRVIHKDMMRAMRIGNCLVSGRVTDEDRERRDFEKTLGDNVILTADVPDSKRKKGDKARIFHGHTYGCLGGNETALVFEGETSFLGVDRSLFKKV